MSGITKEDQELRMELYKAGLTDRQIAERTDAKRDAICLWRLRNGLETNGRVKRKGQPRVQRKAEDKETEPIHKMPGRPKSHMLQVTDLERRYQEQMRRQLAEIKALRSKILELEDTIAVLRGNAI